MNLRYKYLITASINEISITGTLNSGYAEHEQVPGVINECTGMKIEENKCTKNHMPSYRDPFFSFSDLSFRHFIKTYNNQPIMDIIAYQYHIDCIIIRVVQTVLIFPVILNVTLDLSFLVGEDCEIFNPTGNCPSSSTLGNLTCNLGFPTLIG